MAANTEIVIVGGGPAGLTAAIALGIAGVETALVAPAPPADARTTALLASSVAALDRLGIWERCRDQAAPLRVLRLVDDTARLFRAPEITFAAAEIGLDAFGHNIPNRDLLAALEARAAELPTIRRYDSAAEDVTIGGDAVTVRLASGDTIAARLAIGADGRQSLCRRAARIPADRHPLNQTALALSFRHSRPHHDTSTEFHRPEGPFTTVPLPGNRSSLVWVLGPGSARHLHKADGAALSAAVERRSHSIFGKVEVDPERGIFPLVSGRARRLAGNRVALIGEAAHVLPPIGAQGLNLGLRDAAQIAELAIAAYHRRRDPGAQALLTRYDALRRRDILTRALAVDLLNRSLLNDFLPLQSLRAAGLYALDKITPLRRLAMYEGIAPAGAAPRLMRGGLDEAW